MFKLINNRIYQLSSNYIDLGIKIYFAINLQK